MNIWNNSHWKLCPSPTGRIDCVFHNGRCFTWVMGNKFHDFMKSVTAALGVQNSYKLAELLLGNMDAINQMYGKTGRQAV